MGCQWKDFNFNEAKSRVNKIVDLIFICSNMQN